jgi:general secretion pathway protein E
MAIQSSLTGHLVFSTLHTNDSAGAVTRLLDLGLEPYLVSSSVIAVLAQRLVRKICSDCKEEYEPPPQELRALGLGNGRLSLDQKESQKFYRGTGCDRCFQTGYRGRTGVYELMLVDEETQDFIYRRETAGKIKRQALEVGMQTLRMDGARKVLSGTTTIAEVLRVTQADVI